MPGKNFFPYAKMTATIPPQTSLSSVPAYTTWPGGIDPTVSVYRLPATGGKRRRSTRRRTSRKAGRKVNRKSNRTSNRKTERH